jgi:hypothetical protein
MDLKKRFIGGAALLLAVSLLFLLLAKRAESPWRLSLDLSNWRVFGSEGVEFNPEGVRVRSTKAYHIGPITISSERVWTEPKPRAVFRNCSPVPGQVLHSRSIVATGGNEIDSC